MRILLTSCFLALAVSPAFAGWQFTEWGMSWPEVAEAMPDKSGVAEGTMPYEASGMHFNVTFRILENGLEAVTLYPGKGVDCRALQTALLLVYGEPVESRPAMLWRDAENGNMVRFSGVSTGVCDIQYRPIPKPGDGSGL